MRNAIYDRDESEYHLIIETFMQICLYLNDFFTVLIRLTSHQKSEGIIS